jgi:hypothetical protein
MARPNDIDILSKEEQADARKKEDVKKIAGCDEMKAVEKNAPTF